MRVRFYDEPDGGPRSRAEVRFNDLGLSVYEDHRRVAVGFDLTPFLERPSILVRVTNGEGKEAASLSVIEAIQPNFNLTLHLRDGGQKDPYELEAVIYYMSKDGERQVSDRFGKTFYASTVGDQ